MDTNNDVVYDTTVEDCELYHKEVEDEKQKHLLQMYEEEEEELEDIYDAYDEMEYYNCYEAPFEEEAEEERRRLDNYYQDATAEDSELYDKEIEMEHDQMLQMYEECEELERSYIETLGEEYMEEED